MPRADLASTYLTLAEPRDALTYFTVATSLDPRAYSNFGYKCRAFSDLAAYDDAESACERARTLNPESSWVYSVSAQLAEARGDIEKAIEWSDAALKHGSSIAAIQSERARWLVNLGMPGDAGSVYRRAVAENPESTRRSAGLSFAGSVAALDAGGAPGFRKFIDESGLASIEDPDTLLDLANAALMVSDPALAKAYMDRALAVPDLTSDGLASAWGAIDGHSHLLVIAATLRANGDEIGANRRLDELGALLDRVEASGAQTHGLYGLKAEHAALRGHSDEAMASLRRAVQLGWYSAWLAEHQPYLQSLRSRTDYRELIAAVSARNAVTAAKLRSRLLR